MSTPRSIRWGLGKRSSRQLALGAEWAAALEAAGNGRLDETREALTPCSSRKLSAGGFAPDVLAAATYFLHDGDSFSEALTASLRFAGPANYCPVLVGAVGGARWGAGAIGEAVLAHCDVLPRVEAAAADLAARWS